MSGKLITFEGIEGSGKSTQIKLVGEYLLSQGHEVVVTKEPGGTLVGERLRELILSTETRMSALYTELLLFYADRLEHVAQVVQPALDAGKIVLCDRYIDSTTAYQIGGRGIAPEIVDQLNNLVKLMPTQTLLLDIDPEEGLQRAKSRAALDRFEQESLDFHRRLRAQYLKTATENPHRIVTVPVSGKSIDDVFQILIKIIATEG